MIPDRLTLDYVEAIELTHTLNKMRCIIEFIRREYDEQLNNEVYDDHVREERSRCTSSNNRIDEILKNMENVRVLLRQHRVSNEYRLTVSGDEDEDPCARAFVTVERGFLRFLQELRDYTYIRYDDFTLDDIIEGVIRDQSK